MNFSGIEHLPLDPVYLFGIQLHQQREARFEQYQQQEQREVRADTAHERDVQAERIVEVELTGKGGQVDKIV